MKALNRQISKNLRDIADLLDLQDANPFRAQAYRHAAQTIDELETDLSIITNEKGKQALIKIPTIGAGIARSIYEYIRFGRMSRLDYLRGESDPIEMLRVIPGIGRGLAERIFDTLHVNNYEALENALHSGQLSKVPGIGKHRLQTIGTWLLNSMSQHHTEAKHQQDQRDSHRDSPKAANREPSIQAILKLDQVYRQKMKDGQLPLISPKRFNPDNKAWLPILHKTDDEWHFTALFSNTERAHKLNRVFDWVVIYAYDHQYHEWQYTVVTETKGKLLGKRVIRGKEKECLRYYQSTGEAPE